MIRVAQLQHGGSFLSLYWDPMITFFSSSMTDIEESGFYFQEFTTGVHGIVLWRRNSLRSVLSFFSI
jgi:hypothetical protein